MGAAMVAALDAWSDSIALRLILYKILAKDRSKHKYASAFLQAFYRVLRDFDCRDMVVGTDDGQ